MIVKGDSQRDERFVSKFAERQTNRIEAIIPLRQKTKRGDRESLRSEDRIVYLSYNNKKGKYI